MRCTNLHAPSRPWIVQKHSSSVTSPSCERARRRYRTPRGNTDDTNGMRSDICPFFIFLLVWRRACFHVFFRNKKSRCLLFLLSFFFSFSLQSSSRFTFIHAHKCTHKTLLITLNNAQRHEHVLIRSGTYFTKLRNSAECFGRRGSTASISDSWSCSIGNERKRLSTLKFAYSALCKRILTRFSLFD